MEVRKLATNRKQLSGFPLPIRELIRVKLE